MTKLLGSIALVALATASGSLSAQTTGSGPYYATPSWDQTLPAAQRFIVLSNFNNAAVLDRETGLVWERAPSAERLSWIAAINHCIFTFSVGNHLGWRLPDLQELGTLVDKTQTFPSLPPGHPFQGVGGFYWSTSSLPEDDAQAIGVDFGQGQIFSQRKDNDNLSSPAWCVRGPGGHRPLGE